METEVAIRAEQVDARLSGRCEARTIDVHGQAQRRRIPADLLAPRADDRQGVTHLRRAEVVEVQFVRVACSEAPGHVRAVAAHHDRDARLLEAPRQVDRVVDAGGRAIERGTAGGEHPGDDLEVLGQDRQTFAGRTVVVAVRDELILFPSRAETQLGTAAADDIERADHLGRECRIAKRACRARRDPAERARSARPAPRAL